MSIGVSFGGQWRLNTHRPTSGTEANDTALLLATAYRRSNQVLAMRNGYHGRSFSAVGITGNSGWAPTSLSPLRTLYVHGGVAWERAGIDRFEVRTNGGDTLLTVAV